MTEASLRITEVFYSLQGEALTAGLPTVFIRLTGCPLRCGYCDSEYAFFGGERRSIASLFEETAGFSPRYVCVTGGEPLAQPNCLPLLSALCDAGFDVSLETSGALDISGVDARVSVVMDLKRRVLASWIKPLGEHRFAKAERSGEVCDHRLRRFPMGELYDGAA